MAGKRYPNGQRHRPLDLTRHGQHHRRHANDLRSQRPLPPSDYPSNILPPATTLVPTPNPNTAIDLHRPRPPSIPHPPPPPPHPFPTHNLPPARPAQPPHRCALLPSRNHHPRHKDRRRRRAPRPPL